MSCELPQLSLSEDYASLLSVATFAAQQASWELLSRFGKNEGVQSKSNGLDLVSDADIAAERAITAAIRSARPADLIVSEEDEWQQGAAARRDDVSVSSGYTWVIDPLDGTVNYLYGSDLWSISIAVQDTAGAVIGVVTEPTANRQYIGIRGQGAYANGTRITANPISDISQAMLTFGSAYDPDVRAHQGEIAFHVLPRVRDLRRHGSAALELCRVAAGQLDGYFEDPIFEWDIAAGALIAQEAGARVWQGPMDEEHRTSVIAGAAGIQEDLIALVAEANVRGAPSPAQ